MEWAREKDFYSFMAQCGVCLHLDEEQESAGAFICKAFPDGIPNDLLMNKKSHTYPYPGDKGIRFERDLRPK